MVVCALFDNLNDYIKKYLLTYSINIKLFMDKEISILDKMN